jgi:hypothetical protein
MKTRDSLLGTAITKEIRSSDHKGHCPSPEELASLVDGSMEGDARDNLLGHLAQCDNCRQIFVRARELIHEDLPVAERRRYVVPSLLATAAAIVIALTLTLTIRQSAPKKMHVAKQEQGTGPVAIPAEPRQPDTETKEPSGSHQARLVVASSKRRERTRAKERAKAPESLLTLLSAEEAAMPGDRSFGFASSPQQDGPVITAQNMEIENGTTFPLTVSFSPKEGSPVNLATLRLECLKSTPIDLTARVAPYVQRDGVRVDRVSLPSGSYRFRVSIGDVNGRFSEKEFSVTVGATF